MNYFLTFFSEVRWQDIIDIALNSYILFRLYALFRGTNAFRVLLGIALLWFFQRISLYLGLVITSWAIQGIIAAAALIIIVVFRNEIRSVLQAKNLKAIFWGLPHKTGDTPVDIVLETVFELARKQTGALIVFPGKEDIREAVHSGIPWLGLVSKEMLMSIFWHDNPVHDGAAIIQDDKVMEVGSVLPLSRRKDLPSHYGTRHRAAAGLAETTDALIIVVSEERRNVAVAQGSWIRTVRQKAELAELLRDHLGIHEKGGGHLRKERLKLGAAALISVLLIGSVWFSFTRGLDTLITLEVPVEYMNRDPSMEIQETSANAVRLDLSGSGPLIRSIRPEQVTVRLDLSKGVAGLNTFTITRENIALPPGVVLKNIKTPQVEVTLDVLVTKTLPVQVDWVGKLPDHVIISGVTIAPPQVEIIGGKGVLQGISTIYTEKVAVDRIEKSGKLTVGLALNPASLKIAPGSKDKVDLAYNVISRTE